jgi:hypothetical protein
VGDVIAIIENEVAYTPQAPEKVETEVLRVRETIEELGEKKSTDEKAEALKSRTPSGKFLSPLVRISLLQKVLHTTSSKQLQARAWMAGLQKRISSHGLSRTVPAADSEPR